MPSNQLNSTPKARFTVHVGVAGDHLEGSAYVSKMGLKDKIKEVIEAIKSAGEKIWSDNVQSFKPGRPVFRLVSPLLAHSDRVAALAALENKYVLQCPVPSGKEAFEKEFNKSPDFNEIRNCCEKEGTKPTIFALEEPEDGEIDQFLDVKRMILTQSDIVVVIWDGSETDSIRETSFLVKKAMQYNVPIIAVHPEHPHEVSIRVEKNKWKIDDWQEELLLQLKHILAPPGSNVEKDLKALYFSEKPPKKQFLALSYKKIVLFLSGNLFRKRPNINKQAPSLGEVSEYLNKYFTPHYIWADELAVYYANLYRSSFLLRYLGVALAILFAVIGITTQQRYGFILQVALVLLILGVISIGKTKKWHERMVDYRHLAELLRQMHFLAPIGHVLNVNFPAHYVDPNASWVNWHFRAVVRQAGLPEASMTKAYLKVYKEILAEFEIDKQIEYHKENSNNLNKVSNRLERISFWSFVISLAGAGIRASIGNNEVLVYLCIAIPAFGAGFAGVRTHGEFSRIAQRSKAMENKLRSLKQNINSIDLNTRELASIADEVARIMSEEVMDWRIVTKSRPLPLPG